MISNFRETCTCSRPRELKTLECEDKMGKLYHTHPPNAQGSWLEKRKERLEETEAVHNYKEAVCRTQWDNLF